MTKEYIENTLMELGFDPSMKGFHYIVSAEMILQENPESIHAITKEIYPDVAKIHGSTASSVERSIRHAKISAMNEDVDNYIAEQLGAKNLMYHRGDITNSRFLAALMLYLRKNEGGKEAANEKQ